MTATDRMHLTYPSLDRLKARLHDAKAQHLVLWDLSEIEIDPFTVEFTSQCTPSQEINAYCQWLRWDMPSERAHAYCDCTAGFWGVPCKHLALLLDVAGLLDGQTAIRVSDVEDYRWYVEAGELPEWEEGDDAT